jgi:hypothetical protein
MNYKKMFFIFILLCCKGSRPHRSLSNIVSNKSLLRDIGMLSPDVQTASLESYHATVCHFAPKLNSFTYPVMQAKWVILLYLFRFMSFC